MQIKLLYGCQIIANGVIPTIRYYLRLLVDPSAVFQEYAFLLETDKAIKHEHREIWNKIAIQ
jgi:DNA (cytosine-5)-methyltransferase 1